jgi:hypothetical protein
MVNLTPLHLEVTALEMLYQLQVTPAQMQRLAKLAPTTAAPMPAGKAVAVSAEFRKTMEDLRTALVANDDDKIAELSAALDELRTKESPDVEDVDVTANARRQTPGLFRTFSARQVASYVTDYADEFPDPREKLLGAFDDVRKLSDKEWEPLRDEVAGQVGWLVAGLDVAKEVTVAAEAARLISIARALKDDQYQAQLPALEKAVDTLLANVAPTDVIRHFVERSLAELLSNPRLSAAVEARLKQGE